MAIFVDSADTDEVKRAMELGFIRGVTTNPILIARSGKEARQVIAELSEICPGPIFHQVAAGSTGEMVAEAKAFSALLPQRLVVKVPCTLEGLRLVSQIGGEIPCAVTAIFTPAQTYLACQAGARYAIPYVNRLTRAGADGPGLVKTMREIVSEPGVEILAASLKSPQEVISALLSGAHHVTAPLKVIEAMAENNLTAEALAEFAAA
ncbi:MAG: transaldolase family protein [Anaerolineae bacterium]